MPSRGETRHGRGAAKLRAHLAEDPTVKKSLPPARALHKATRTIVSMAITEGEKCKIKLIDEKQRAKNGVNSWTAKERA